MTRRAFASQLNVVLAAVSVALAGEGALVAWHCWPQGPGAALRAAVWSLGLWCIPGLLAALPKAAAIGALVGEEPVGATLQDQWATPERRDRFAAGLLVAGPLLAGVFLVSRRGAVFHNTELFALLLAGAVLVAVVLALVLGFLVWRWAQRRRAAGRETRLATLACGVSLSCFVWPLYVARAGLAQLDPRLLVMPLLYFAAFWVGDRSRRLRGLGRRSALGWGLVAGAAWLAFLLAEPAAPAKLASAGTWSKPLIALGQSLTDFDRDGYSSLLGGGDCAPFDAAVGPAAAELPGDGVDNNCIGGDAGKTSQPRRPSWGAQAHGSPQDLDVVIITIETLRRDHASFSSGRRDTTPQLRELASESLVFERMYSSAPLTRLAVASLFSSYAPSEIDWQPQAPEKRMRHLGPQTPWLPELLSARGYETIAVLSDFSAFTEQESAGFERGFRHYDTSTRLHYRGGTMWGFPAAEQVDKAIALLEQARRPFLLWLHLFEPHYRYEQPPDAPDFGSDDQARYDAEIWHVDSQIGRLIAALKRLEVWDKTVMFVSGDHGEAFGEHDDRWHGSNLFDPQLCPAALLRVPQMNGKRISEATSFTDVAPTIARVLGDRATFEQLRGRSLTPLLHRGKLAEDARSFIAESFSVDDGHAYQAALVAYPLKLIYVEDGRRFSLFDLAADPGETNAIEPSSDPRAAPLLTELVGYLERARPRSLSRR